MSLTLLHKDGRLVEADKIEVVRPHSVNKVNGERSVEISFVSGERGIFSDYWWAKGFDGMISVYDALLGAKFPVEWQDKLKFGG